MVLIVRRIVTGCRRSEIAALKWEDVDFENRTLKISKAIDTTPGAGGDLKSTKTHASVCMVFTRSPSPSSQHAAVRTVGVTTTWSHLVAP